MALTILSFCFAAKNPPPVFYKLQKLRTSEKVMICLTACVLPLSRCTVKCTLVQALRLCTGRTARTGIRGIIALSFLDHGTRRGWRVSVTPRPHFTPGKNPVPIVQGRLGGPQQGRFRQVRKNSPPPTGIRSPDRPARSQSLYRLSYPAHSLYSTNWI